MTQNYEVIVKGIRNFENKVTVTLALRDKKCFDGEIFDLDISLDRVEGAALEFYEAAARRSIRQVFLEEADKLSEKVESYLQHQYSIKIENSANKHDRPHLAGFDSAVKANTRRAGQEKNAGDDISRAMVTVELPWHMASRVKVGKGGAPVLTKRIGSKVSVWLDNEEMLSVMYKEDYDPKTTFSDYEARAKKYALSIVAAMRAVNERQRHHENGVAFVAKAVQQTIDGMTTKFLQELKLSQQE